jgi:SAM-dependent methyltransferase
MPGFVETLSARRVTGWAYDPKRKTPAAVKVVLDEAVVAEGVANLRRDDVATALKTSGFHGFDILLKGKLAAADVHKLQVLSSSGSGWKVLEVLKSTGAPPARRSYQDFDGTGSSKSHEKLEALRLDILPRADRAMPLLHGKAVLDIGCNEGFFCIEAVREGASRVVGIDQKASVIESARRRCPEATFIHGNWWKIPDEKFDCIFFLSAMHYEPQPRKLLRKLRDHLTPGGVLILECGVIAEPRTRAWRTIRRGDGVMRYPTLELLRRDILADFAVRRVGGSAAQKGDPIARQVFHCTPHAAIAMIIAARSRSGKTVFSFQLGTRDIPTYSTDLMFSRLFRREDQAWRPVAQKLRERFPPEGRRDLVQVALYVVENKLEDELCEIIADEAPAECSLFGIEGDVLRHASVQEALKRKLIARNIRPWLVTPL